MGAVKTSTFHELIESAPTSFSLLMMCHTPLEFS